MRIASRICILLSLVTLAVFFSLLEEKNTEYRERVLIGVGVEDDPVFRGEPAVAEALDGLDSAFARDPRSFANQAVVLYYSPYTYVFGYKTVDPQTGTTTGSVDWDFRPLGRSRGLDGWNDRYALPWFARFAEAYDWNGLVQGGNWFAVPDPADYVDLVELGYYPASMLEGLDRIPELPLAVPGGEADFAVRPAFASSWTDLEGVSRYPEGFKRVPIVIAGMNLFSTRRPESEQPYYPSRYANPRISLPIFSRASRASSGVLAFEPSYAPASGGGAVYAENLWNQVWSRAPEAGWNTGALSGLAVRSAADPASGGSAQPADQRVILMVADGRTNTSGQFYDMNQFDSIYEVLNHPDAVSEAAPGTDSEADSEAASSSNIFLYQLYLNTDARLVSGPDSDLIVDQLSFLGGLVLSEGVNYENRRSIGRVNLGAEPFAVGGASAGTVAYEPASRSLILRGDASPATYEELRGRIGQSYAPAALRPWLELFDLDYAAERETGNLSALFARHNAEYNFFTSATVAGASMDPADTDLRGWKRRVFDFIAGRTGSYAEYPEAAGSESFLADVLQARYGDLNILADTANRARLERFLGSSDSLILSNALLSDPLGAMAAADGRPVLVGVTYSSLLGAGNPPKAELSFYAAPGRSGAAVERLEGMPTVDLAGLTRTLGGIRNRGIVVAGALVGAVLLLSFLAIRRSRRRRGRRRRGRLVRLFFRLLQIALLALAAAAANRFLVAPVLKAQWDLDTVAAFEGELDRTLGGEARDPADTVRAMVDEILRVTSVRETDNRFFYLLLGLCLVFALASIAATALRSGLEEAAAKKPVAGLALALGLFFGLQALLFLVSPFHVQESERALFWSALVAVLALGAPASALWQPSLSEEARDYFRGSRRSFRLRSLSRFLVFYSLFELCACLSVSYMEGGSAGALLDFFLNNRIVAGALVLGALGALWYADAARRRGARPDYHSFIPSTKS